MKKTLFVTLALLFSSSAFAAYDKTWYQTEYWSGEWPNGFSVAKPGVTVVGRTAMDKDLAPTVSCALPFKAVFNPWNSQRNTLSDAHYFTASKIVPLVAKEDFDFNYEDAHKIAIKKGQVIEYLIYGAEGYFTVRINGQELEADQTLFDHVQAVPDDAYAQEEWVRLKCENGNVAWLYKADLTKTAADGSEGYIDGLWNASIGNPGIDGYGQARDLTDDEISKGGN